MATRMLPLRWLKPSTLTRIEGRPARQTSASRPRTCTCASAAPGRTASAAANRPAFARYLNITALLLGADAGRADGPAWLYQAPMALQIVQACGQIVVAARRNGGEPLSAPPPGPCRFPD